MESRFTGLQQQVTNMEEKLKKLHVTGEVDLWGYKAQFFNYVTIEMAS